MNQKKGTQFQKICEGNTSLFVYDTLHDVKGPGKKQGLPFYNPAMELNRDISIAVLQYLVDNSTRLITALDGLASSGIRGIRFLNEVNGEVSITINDWEDDAFVLIKKNAKQFPSTKVTITQENIHTLLSDQHYDYIDIDPFGSPATYIDSALRGINKNGILAVTATDTATLCGVYPKVCIRRYNAVPAHGLNMHEVGLRILIGYIGRMAGKFDKGIKPIFCYSTDHYMRCYIQIIKGVTCANDSQKNISFISSKKIPGQEKKKETMIGPMWMKDLHAKKILEKINRISEEKQLNCKKQLMKLFTICLQEANMPPFYYSTDALSKDLKVSPPSRDLLFQTVKEKRFTICQTHFDPTGFKTNASYEQLQSIFLDLTKKQ